MGLFQSSGRLRYCDNFKIIVEIDPQIAAYYRSLIPKWYTVNQTRYVPHVTVVRNEIPKNKDAWGKHYGKKVQFEYSGWINVGRIYYWLNVHSAELEAVRTELGLAPTSNWSRPPSEEKCFHTTIGNRKSI
jgi:2'-5' RNA ligase